MRRCCLILTSFWVLVAPSMASDATLLEGASQESKLRAAVVKRIQNAVVHIDAEKTVDDEIVRRGNDPYELFNDDLLERLFPGVRPQGPSQKMPHPKQQGLGTGSIVTKDGYILTNHHVVGGADKITVKLADGREFNGKIIGTDPDSDVAVIQIEGKDLPTLPFGDSEEIEVGESVIAIGNPFGFNQTVTFGIISAKGRSKVGITNYENFIQTDAAINPGNSGGPLINLKGEMIGLNTAIFSRTGGYQGIGFAIPSKMAKHIMDELIATGTVARGWLGVNIQDVDAELAKTFGLDHSTGALIAQVMPNTPASQYGLKQGDIILKVGDKVITDGNSLMNEIALIKAGTSVPLEVLRRSQKITLTITLGERPSQVATGTRSATEPTPEFGLIVQNINPELGQKLGIENPQGVVITQVVSGSPAFESGLQPGMVIREVNQREVKNTDDFREALKEASFKKGILLLVQTAKGSQYLIIKSDS